MYSMYRITASEISHNIARRSRAFVMRDSRALSDLTHSYTRATDFKAKIWNMRVLDTVRGHTFSICAYISRCKADLLNTLAWSKHCMRSPYRCHLINGWTLTVY